MTRSRKIRALVYCEKYKTVCASHPVNQPFVLFLPLPQNKMISHSAVRWSFDSLALYSYQQNKRKKYKTEILTLIGNVARLSPWANNKRTPQSEQVPFFAVSEYSVRCPLSRWVRQTLAIVLCAGGWVCVPVIVTVF